MYVYGSSSTSSVTQCQFINNAASGNGGAIYKTGSNDNLMIYENSYNIINNITYSFGGAVYVLGTNASVTAFSMTTQP